MDDERKSLLRRNNALRMQRRQLPQHLINLETHVLLKDAINLNDLLKILLDTPEYNNLFAKLVRDINNIIDIFKQTNASIENSYFIGGSKAWNNFFKDFYDLNAISQFEKSSIHNTTADLFYFINDKDVVNALYDNINILLSTSIAPLVDAIRTYFKLDDSKNVYITIENKIALDGKNVFFPSKQIFLRLHINDSQPKDRKISIQSSQVSQSMQGPYDAEKKAKSELKRKEKKERALLEEKERQKKEEELKAKQSMSRAERAASRNLRKTGGTIDSFDKIILSSLNI